MKKILPIIIIAVLILPQITWAACTWYGTGDPATADDFEQQGDTALTWVQNLGFTLPAGTVSFLRVYMATNTYAQGIKLGLYSGGTLVISGTEPSPSTGTNFYQQVTVADTVISAGNYQLAFKANEANDEATYSTLSGQTSGTEYVNFSSCAYSAFPCGSSIVADDLDRTRKFFVGACVTPSGGGGNPIINYIINLFGWE